MSKPLRRRRWVLDTYFSERGRPLPKTRERRTLWCRDCKDSHEFTTYATWIWVKPGRKRISLNKFFETTIRAYAPFLESNLMSYRPSIKCLFGEKHEYPAPKPDCLSKMAALYGFEGKP